MCTEWKLGRIRKNVWQRSISQQRKEKLKVVKKRRTTKIIGNKNRVTIAHCSTIQDRRLAMEVVHHVHEVTYVKSFPMNRMIKFKFNTDNEMTTDKWSYNFISFLANSCRTQTFFFSSSNTQESFTSLQHTTSQIQTYTTLVPYGKNNIKKIQRGNRSTLSRWISHRWNSSSCKPVCCFTASVRVVLSFTSWLWAVCTDIVWMW